MKVRRVQIEEIFADVLNAGELMPVEHHAITGAMDACDGAVSPTRIANSFRNLASDLEKVADEIDRKPFDHWTD
jgi:hypothetical protein